MRKLDSKASYKHNSSKYVDDVAIGSEAEANELNHSNNSVRLGKTKKAKLTSAAKAFAASKYINDDARPKSEKKTKAKGSGESAVRETVVPELRSIDTMEMDAPLNEQQIERAIGKLKLMVNDKRARRVTNESRFWEAKFSVPLGTGRQGERSVSITFYFVCTAKNSNVPMRLQFNVGLIRDEHVKRLIEVFKEVFPLDYKEVARSLRIHGVDEAYDRTGSLEDFILERGSSTTVERYYIKTSAGGEIQTSYIGSVDSPSHGVLYDLGSADAYRNARGQAVPLNKDTATHVFKCRMGMIRIESRRVFKSPLTMQDLLRLPSAFHEYQFFDLTRLPARKRRDPVFIGYVDSVRLRGVHSASKRLEAALGGGRPAARQVAEFEERLGRANSTWWSAIDHRQQLGVLLRAAPIWQFLRLTARLS